MATTTVAKSATRQRLASRASTFIIQHPCSPEHQSRRQSAQAEHSLINVGNDGRINLGRVLATRDPNSDGQENGHTNRQGKDFLFSCALPSVDVHLHRKTQKTITNYDLHLHGVDWQARV